MSQLCPKCGYKSAADIECLRCGIVFEKFKLSAYNSVVPISDTEIDEVVIEEPKNNIFNNYKLNIYALPAGLMISFMIQKLWVFQYLVFLFCVIPLHELGHAFTAWMTGHIAVPIGAIVPTAGMTIIGQDRHIWVNIVFISIFGYLIFKSWAQRLLYFCALGTVFILVSLYLCLSLTNQQINTLISFGGIAGEFLLSTVLILSFYQPSFKKLRWDFFRFPFFIMGCMAFVNACSMWIRIKNKLDSLPFGSAISTDGAGDSNGDMNRLITAGWSEELIVSRYLILGKIAATLIIIQYIYYYVTAKTKE
ncbi:MAG: hypothetical protein WA160_14620 [Pseudobdellovibrio sp.]